MQLCFLLARMVLSALFVVSFGLPRTATAQERPFGGCDTSPRVTAEPPPAEGADPFGSGPWYVNADRTIWARGDPGFWHVGRNKVLWIRPGRTLTVEGTRIDAEAPPLKADIPCCFSKRIQATALHFPTVGCWRVTAKAGDHELTFITAVKRYQPPH